MSFGARFNITMLGPEKVQNNKLLRRFVSFQVETGGGPHVHTPILKSNITIRYNNSGLDKI